MTVSDQGVGALADAMTRTQEERRSPRWESTRRAFLAKWPQCAVCGPDAVQAGGGLNVHHVVPVEFVRRAGRGERGSGAR